MFNFVSKTFLHGGCILKAAPTQKLGLLHKLSVSGLLSPRLISTNSNQDSEVVSFLINSCGLSPKSALTVSKKFPFKTLRNPKLVLSLFTNHGFSQTQISKIIEKAPWLLLYQLAEKTLLPKFGFFLSKGISSSDLATLVYTYPGVLAQGLDTKLVPNYNALEEFFKSKEEASAIVKCMPSILSRNIEGTVVNLRGHGVPDANIALFIRKWSYLLISSPSDSFNQAVETVRDMGFSPMTSTFIIELAAVRVNGKARWKKRVNLYKSWGWSDVQILAAFRKYPWCMLTSEAKIAALMDFFVNKMGWEASVVAERSELFTYSLEKRFLPRASVIQFLLSHGLLEQKKVVQMFKYTEKVFVQKCLTSLKDKP